jgi:hypothetical protein
MSMDGELKESINLDKKISEVRKKRREKPLIKMRFFEELSI